jgi:hypothetical protein
MYRRGSDCTRSVLESVDQVQLNGQAINRNKYQWTRCSQKKGMISYKDVIKPVANVSALYLGR